VCSPVFGLDAQFGMLAAFPMDNEHDLASGFDAYDDPGDNYTSRDVSTPFAVLSRPARSSASPVSLGVADQLQAIACHQGAAHASTAASAASQDFSNCAAISRLSGSCCVAALGSEASCGLLAVQLSTPQRCFSIASF
jgi:hypothetical protein